MLQPAIAESLEQRLARQCGILRTDQALRYLTEGELRWLLRSKRWQRRCPRVLVTHSGPPSHEQEVWAAVLHCGKGAVLAGATAAALDGLRGYEAEAVHVAIPHGARPGQWPAPTAVGSPPGSSHLAVTESRLLGPEFVHPTRAPRRTRLERSLLDIAATAATAERTCAVLAAGVQQRLTTPDRLASMLDLLPRLRKRALLTETITDVAGGAHSVPEREFLRIVRNAHLPQPDRQALLQRPNGRYYLDARWHRYATAAEIDGSGHFEIETWWRDIERMNEIGIDGTVTVRFVSFHVRHRPDYIEHVLGARLRAAGWRAELTFWQKNPSLSRRLLLPKPGRATPELAAETRPRCGTCPARRGTCPAGCGTCPAGCGTCPARRGTCPARRGTCPARRGTCPELAAERVRR